MAFCLISLHREEQMWTMDDKTGEVMLSPIRPKPRKAGTKRGAKSRKGLLQEDTAAETGLSPVLSSDQVVSGADEEMMLPLVTDDDLAAKVPDDLEDRPEMHTPKAPAVSCRVLECFVLEYPLIYSRCFTSFF